MRQGEVLVLAIVCPCALVHRGSHVSPRLTTTLLMYSCAGHQKAFGCWVSVQMVTDGYGGEVHNIDSRRTQRRRAEREPFGVGGRGDGDGEGETERRVRFGFWMWPVMGGQAIYLPCFAWGDPCTARACQPHCGAAGTLGGYGSPSVLTGLIGHHRASSALLDLMVPFVVSSWCVCCSAKPLNTENICWKCRGGGIQYLATDDTVSML